MFLILNRLRGTKGTWSKTIGVYLAFITQIVFNDAYTSLLVGLGYIIGESFGWGLWVGALSIHRENTPNKTEDEGASNGIQWLAREIVPNWVDNFLVYCRVAMFLRGLYWYSLILMPLCFVGISFDYISLNILFLSLCFPLAYELGYHFRESIRFNKFGISYEGGWELGEGFVGLSQDISFVSLILYVYLT